MPGCFQISHAFCSYMASMRAGRGRSITKEMCEGKIPNSDKESSCKFISDDPATCLMKCDLIDNEKDCNSKSHCKFDNCICSDNPTPKPPVPAPSPPSITPFTDTECKSQTVDNCNQNKYCIVKDDNCISIEKNCFQKDAANCSSTDGCLIDASKTCVTRPDICSKWTAKEGDKDFTEKRNQCINKHPFCIWNAIDSTKYECQNASTFCGRPPQKYSSFPETWCNSISSNYRDFLKKELIKDPSVGIKDICRWDENNSKCLSYLAKSDDGSGGQTPIPTSAPIKCKDHKQKDQCNSNFPPCFWNTRINKCLDITGELGCSSIVKEIECIHNFEKDGDLVPESEKDQGICRYTFTDESEATKECVPVCKVYKDKDDCNSIYGCEYDDTNKICNSKPTPASTLPDTCSVKGCLKAGEVCVMSPSCPYGGCCSQAWCGRSGYRKKTKVSCIQSAYQKTGTCQRDTSDC